MKDDGPARRMAAEEQAMRPVLLRNARLRRGLGQRRLLARCPHPSVTGRSEDEIVVSRES